MRVLLIVAALICAVAGQSPPPPPPASGACCAVNDISVPFGLPDTTVLERTCSIQSPADCAAQGRRYLGNDTVCLVADLPPGAMQFLRPETCDCCPVGSLPILLVNNNNSFNLCVEQMVDVMAISIFGPVYTPECDAGTCGYRRVTESMFMLNNKTNAACTFATGDPCPSAPGCLDTAPLGACCAPDLADFYGPDSFGVFCIFTTRDTCSGTYLGDRVPCPRTLSPDGSPVFPGCPCCPDDQIQILGGVGSGRLASFCVDPGIELGTFGSGDEFLPVCDGGNCTYETVSGELSPPPGYDPQCAFKQLCSDGNITCGDANPFPMGCCDLTSTEHGGTICATPEFCVAQGGLYKPTDCKADAECTAPAPPPPPPMPACTLEVKISSVEPLGMDQFKLTANTTGGTPPISLEWMPGFETTTMITVGPGMYSVMATDSAGCISVDMITIFPSPPECAANNDCSPGQCCADDGCVSTADACLKCPDDLSFGNCTEVSCNVALPCLTVDGVDVLAALQALDEN